MRARRHWAHCQRRARLPALVFVSLFVGIQFGLCRNELRADEEITFLHPLDDKPIEFKFRPDQVITPAVKQFRRTGKNPYSGEEQAITVGRKYWLKWCRGCHLTNGTGRIGPNLVDDDYSYPRVATDIGLFEIIYAGGTGAMQAFGKRIDQDEILKVMAFLETLRKR